MTLALLTPRFRQTAEFTAVALGVQAAAFWGYLSGRTTPSWDFLGPYGPSAYGFWNSGTFFHPQQWETLLWNGFPTAAAVQNSAYYLPVAIANEMTPYTPYVAAVLSAMHASLGMLGAYVLCRRLGQSHLPALLVSVGYFFGPGFFNGASHVDILRGWAWLPWLLLLASPLWPWKRWWAAPLGAVMIWQILTGVYPGFLAACGYAVGVWVVVWCTRLRHWQARRVFVVRLGLTALIGGLLSAVKWVPALLLSTGPATSDVMTFDLGKLGSIFLPYGDLTIAGDKAMASFFIPAACLVLALSVRAKPALRPMLGLLVVAALLGLPTLPTYKWAHHLPLLDLGRFHLNDFRAFLVLGILLCAGAAADQMWARGERPTRRLVPAAVLIAGSAVALGVALHPGGWPGAVLIAMLGAAAVVLGSVSRSERHRAAFQRVAVGTAIAGGLMMAYTTTAPWSQPRDDVETLAYGAPVSQLLAERSVDSGPRPARSLVGGSVEAAQSSVRGLAAFYTGDPTIAAYSNSKRNPVVNQQMREIDASPALRLFYEAPQTAVPVVWGALAPVTQSCLADGSCGGLQVDALSYRPGHFRYGILVPWPALIAFNETYYDGWQAQVCNAAGCTAAEVQSGPGHSLSVKVPRGVWQVKLDYQAPGLRVGWLCFWLGTALGGVWTLMRLYDAWRYRLGGAEPLST